MYEQENTSTEFVVDESSEQEHKAQYIHRDTHIESDKIQESAPAEYSTMIRTLAIARNRPRATPRLTAARYEHHRHAFTRLSTQQPSREQRCDHPQTIGITCD